MTQLKEIARVVPDRAQYGSNRDRLVTTVEQHPGEGVDRLAGLAGVPSWTARPALKRLVKQRTVKEVKLDGLLRYYPASAKVSGEVERAFRCPECGKEFEKRNQLSMHKIRMHTEVGKAQNWAHHGQGGRKKLLTWLADHPHVNMEAIREGLGWEVRYVNRIVSKLSKEGAITRTRINGVYTYAMPGTAEPQALAKQPPPPPTSNVEQLAKDYLWETGNTHQQHALQQFSNWCKDKS